MKEERENIFTVFDELIGRAEHESLLEQKGGVFWLTGLSGSGKTTIAKGAQRIMHDHGRFVQVLDGDNIRVGLNNNLGFSNEDRTENIRRIAEVSKLFASCGVITINCFVSPTLEIRQMARDIIGEDFHEVYIKADLADCEDRDPKGLYKKARAGEIKDFTGIDAPFEAPENAELTIDTSAQSIEQSVESLVTYIEPISKL